MLEIFALIFLARKIGELAYQKGQPTARWKIFLVLAWIAFEIIGVVIGVALFGTENTIGLLLFAVVCAFGGYLLVRGLLMRMPDAMDDEINHLGENVKTPH